MFLLSKRKGIDGMFGTKEGDIKSLYFGHLVFLFPHSHFVSMHPKYRGMLNTDI
jgi:hypothetical protein